MACDYQRFWNEADLDGYAAASNLEARLRAILEVLEIARPRSVLEIGAGPGSIAIRIAEHLRIPVVASDVADVFLAAVRGRAVRASAARLPFDVGAFDAIVASEVLEHLEEPVLAQAVAEMDRVASRWLVVTVPYREQLAVEALRCPGCDAHFNTAGHLREVDDGMVLAWFPRRALQLRRPIGERRRVPGALAPWLRRLAGSHNPSWVEGTTYCPACGARVRLDPPSSSLRAALTLRARGLLWHLGRKTPGQVLYAFGAPRA